MYSSDYTKEPIMPGQKGQITLKFDSTNFDGVVYKSAEVYANVSQVPIKLDSQQIFNPKNKKMFTTIFLQAQGGGDFFSMILPFCLNDCNFLLLNLETTNYQAKERKTISRFSKTRR